jgi:hypothetical protein
MKIKIILLFLFIRSQAPGSCAQIQLGFGSFVAPTFFNAKSGSLQLRLPEKGTITLFYFPFSKTVDVMAADYLHSLTDVAKQLNIYQIVIDTVSGSADSELTVLMPTDKNFLQPFWEKYLAIRENLFLLMDREQKVVFYGPLSAPEKFNQILERLGLDLSLPEPVTLEKIISNYAALKRIKTGTTIDYQDVLNSRKPKILFFYRSLCAPCGEDLLIKEVLNTLQKQNPAAMDVMLVFRNLNEDNRILLNSLAQNTGSHQDYFYEAQKLEPNIERFFLNGNPLLLYFNADNLFIEARAGNQMGPKAVEAFLNRSDQ